MSENDIKANIARLVQKIEKIKNILTNRNLYGIGLSPKPSIAQRGLFNLHRMLIKDIGESIFFMYYPTSVESTVFRELLETKIAMNIGIEEFNFYKEAFEEDRIAFMRGSRSQDSELSYSDLVKLDAYIEIFQSISNRAKSLVNFMITDNLEEALDISAVVESLCIIGINKNLIEIENLHREAKELIINGVCENLKDAFAILLDINIDRLMEERIQNSVVAPEIRILELKQNNSNLITGHSNTGKRALKLNINRYLNNGNFKDLSEVYNLCIDPVIDNRYKNNPFKEICERLDQNGKLEESGIEEFKINIKRSLRNFNANSIRTILKKFSKPELINTFNELANDKFENMGNFIVNELNKNLDEVTRRERGEIEEVEEIPQLRDEAEIQRIRERNLRIIRRQQLEVQARQAELDQEIFQESDIDDQEANIDNFKTVVERNSHLPIAAIYQKCISGVIMFFVEKDPFEELFTELDKIIKNEKNITERKNKILNKMEELKDEINIFLMQIEKDDKEKLNLYLSDPIVKNIFDEKSDNLYSNLILNTINSMMTKTEKNTSKQCCIY